jgi:hypothetical protein
MTDKKSNHDLAFDMPEIDDIVIVKEWVEPHPNTTLLIMKIKRILPPCIVFIDFVKVFTDGKVCRMGGNMDLRTVQSIEYSTSEKFEMLQNLYKNDSISS